MSDMESCGVDIGLLNEIFTSKSEPDNAKYLKDGFCRVGKYVARMLSRDWKLSNRSATVSHRRSKKACFLCRFTSVVFTDVTKFTAENGQQRRWGSVVV